MISTSPTYDRHMRAVSDLYAVHPKAIESSSKARLLVEARRDLVYRLTVIERWSLTQTGRRVGKRDHTTILHNVRKQAEKLGFPPETSLVSLREAWHAQQMGRAA